MTKTKTPEYVDEEHVIGQTYICPVCEKEFKLTEWHKYRIGKDPTCCWKCFSDYDKAHPHITKKK